jgi:hypothetical protein
MLRLTNTTPFSAGLDILPDARGVDTLYVAVKATFRIGSSLSVAEEQVPLQTHDGYWGEPGQSSIKCPGDRHPCKPSTDVLLLGHAHAPRGKAVTELDVTLSVASIHKVVRVMGDRVWKGGRVFSRTTDPEPFVSMPLVYERAFGGRHEPERGEPTFESRNPVGRGFMGKRGGADMDGLPVPNLEDPRTPFRDARDRSAPACFAPVAPSWSPRKNHAGTYDDRWRRYRAPYLPEDFNPLFFNTAPPELISPRYLRGGEPVRIVNASPEGPLHFSLPSCRLALEIHIAGRMEQPHPSLETVLFEPDERRMCMLWRASVPCDKKVLQVQQVVVQLDELRLAN